MKVPAAEGERLAQVTMMNIKRHWARGAGFGVMMWATCVFAQGPSEAPPPPSTEPAPTDVSREEKWVPDFESEPISDRDPFETGFPKKIVPGEESTDQTELLAAGKQFMPDQYKVSGMVWGLEKAKAIINDQIVGVGDVVDEATIKRITKEGILVEFDGQEYLLKRESGGSPGGES